MQRALGLVKKFVEANPPGGGTSGFAILEPAPARKASNLIMGRAKGVLSRYISPELLKMEWSSGVIYVKVKDQKHPTRLMSQYQGKWSIDDAVLACFTDNKLTKTSFLDEVSNL